MLIAEKYVNFCLFAYYCQILNVKQEIFEFLSVSKLKKLVFSISFSNFLKKTFLRNSKKYLLTFKINLFTINLIGGEHHESNSRDLYQFSISS
jgi:hypothetical protein